MSNYALANRMIHERIAPATNTSDDLAWQDLNRLKAEDLRKIIVSLRIKVDKNSSKEARIQAIMNHANRTIFDNPI